MIIWDKDKNLKLQIERKISFEAIADIILRFALSDAYFKHCS